MSDRLGAFAACRPVDVTAFVGAFPWRLRASIDAAALGRQADRLGLSGLCLSHLASVFGHDTRTGNEELLDITSTDTRFWFTPVINPTEPGWQAELGWSVAHGARGVRLVPGYHGYTVGHPAMAELLAASNDLGIAIHLCATVEDPRERHPRYRIEECGPSDVADFLRAAVGQPVVVSGLRTLDWPGVHSCLDHGHDLRRVLLDTWRMNGPVGALSGMCNEGWATLLAYGSCQPIQEAVASAYQLATAVISPEDRRALAAQNARGVLPGIPSAGQSDAPTGSDPKPQ